MYDVVVAPDIPLVRRNDAHYINIKLFFVSKESAVGNTPLKSDKLPHATSSAHIYTELPKTATRYVQDRSRVACLAGFEATSIRPLRSTELHLTIPLLRETGR